MDKPRNIAIAATVLAVTGVISAIGSAFHISNTTNRRKSDARRDGFLDTAVTSITSFDKGIAYFDGKTKSRYEIKILSPEDSLLLPDSTLYEHRVFHDKGKIQDIVDLFQNPAMRDTLRHGSIVLEVFETDSFGVILGREKITLSPLSKAERESLRREQARTAQREGP